MTGDDEAVVLRETEYDVYNCAELASELSAVTIDVPVIDFGHVRYVDSTCLTELVKTYKRLAANGKRLRLINVNSNVRQVFGITGLDNLFDISEVEAR